MANKSWDQKSKFLNLSTKKSKTALISMKKLNGESNTDGLKAQTTEWPIWDWYNTY